jgi:group I intron endonuclease
MFNIYVMTNSVNNKVYIGQTIRPLIPYLRTDFTRAIKNHEKDRKPKLYHAMRKHGEAAFTIKLLANAPDKIYADMLEQFFIKVYKSQDRTTGYNIASGGGGSFGYKRAITDRERELRRQNGLKRKHTQEEKDKIRQAHLGKPKSEAHKEKLKGPKSEAHKAAMRKPKTPLSLERRAEVTEMRRLNKLRKLQLLEA